MSTEKKIHFSHYVSTNLRNRKREQVPQHALKDTAIYFSEKHQKVAYLKPLERDYAILLDHDNSVLSYEIAPKLTGTLGPDIKELNASFLVHRTDCTTVVCVISTARRNCVSLQKLNRLVRLISSSLSYDYKIVTDKELVSDRRLANLKSLQAASAEPCPRREFDLIKPMLKTGSRSAKEVLSILQGSDLEPSMLKKFVAHKLLNADLSLAWADMRFTAKCS